MFEIVAIAASVIALAFIFVVPFYTEKKDKEEKARKEAEEKRIAKAHEDFERDMDKLVGNLCEDFAKMMIQVPFEIAKEESKH